MATYLPPIEKPKGLMLRIVYFFTRREFGKVATPIAVFSSRVPSAFLSFYGKVSRLDKKLEVPKELRSLVREQVASINGCHFCMDAARYYALKESIDIERFDALPQYQSSPLFTEAERAALDYASELTREKAVSQTTFDRLSHSFSERQICEIVWLVASEHLYNMSNIALNIGSDGLCEISTSPSLTAARS